MSELLVFCFFFFQAEDGIRDLIVTGVQTCALPIWRFDFHGWAGHSPRGARDRRDRKSTRLNSSHDQISYAVFCLKKKKQQPKMAEDKKKTTRPRTITFR